MRMQSLRSRRILKRMVMKIDLSLCEASHKQVYVE